MATDEELVEPTRRRPHGHALFLVSQFQKKWVGPFFLKALKSRVLGKLWFSKFLRAKPHKVFNTVVFLETAVFLEYFKNLELPNGA
jgi:hypothetical protein